MALYDGYSSAGDPGGGRDTTKFYAFDGKAHADAINTNTAAIAALSSADSATVATAESTTSTTYADLTTTTDQVTVTVGASGKVLLFFAAHISTAGTTANFYVSVALSGANTQAASDAMSITGNNNTQGSPITPGGRTGVTQLLKGLTPGVTTFKMKYRSPTSGTGTFANRNIGVIPFP